jgi:hypothetical protein
MKKEFTELDIINWIKWTKFLESNGRRFDYVYDSIKNGELVPFVGSGLSAFVYGSWSEVMIKLADGLPSDIKQKIVDLINTRDFYAAGDILRTTILDCELSLKMNKIFATHKLDVNKRQQFTQEAVYYIPLLSQKKKRCYTTNFDKVLEEVFLAQSLHCTSVNPIELNKISQLEGNEDMILLKLHGSINSPSVNFILSNSDVHKHYAKESDLLHCLEDSILQHTLFFLGAGLNMDITVKKLKELKNKRSDKPHFAIISAKCGEDLETRTKELDSMNIIPLFYPNYDELGRKWVPIILKWLADDHNPYKDEELKSRIQHFEESGKYKYTTYNMRSDFQDRRGDFGQFNSFLDISHRFLWWQVCGCSESGKTRWMHELMAIAREQGWSSYIYDDENYEDFTIEYFLMDKNTLIIFDDANLYDMEINADKYKISSDAKFAFKGFSKIMHKLINMSRRDTKKLRIIFTFTNNNERKGVGNSKRIKNWWVAISDSEQPIANAFESSEFPGGPLELRWTQDDLEVFCKNFINKNYADEPRKETAMSEVFNIIMSDLNKITPLICMIYIDAFFDKRDKEDIFKFLADYFRYRSGKKKYKKNVDLFLKEHKKNLEYLIKIGKNKLNVQKIECKENRGLKDSLGDENPEVQKEL